MAFTSNEFRKGLNSFIKTAVHLEQVKKSKNREIALQVLKDLFKRINLYEPRFGINFEEGNGSIRGLQMVDANHIELRVYLDQIDFFITEENGAPKGATFIDIKDDKSKEFCIWSEFLTAAGHLSARKIRERFQTILSQTVGRTSWTNKDLYVSVNRSQPRLTINDFVIDVYPAFQLEGHWPKSGRKQFMNPHTGQPGKTTGQPGKTTGQPDKTNLKIDLVSKETGSTKPYSTDRDAWHMDFLSMENQVLKLKNRGICFEVIRKLVNVRLSARSAVFESSLIRTIFMYICEKQSSDESWVNEKLPDRINAFLLQLVASLQNQCLPHFYLSNLNLLECQSSKAVHAALREAWRLARDFCTNPYLFEEQLTV